MALRGFFVPGRTIVVAGGILIAGLAATIGLRTLSEHLITAEMQRRFAADAADSTTALGERLRTHAEVLVSMQGLHASMGRVDRAQFRRYIDVLDLARRYPGFLALQSLRHVTADGLDAFIAEVRGDTSVEPAGQPDFAIRPAGQRPSYDVIEFVEPMRGNESALGLDASANSETVDALRRAAETGRIVATPPMKLVQDTSGGLGFVLRAPIYRAGEPAQTVTQRMAALRGFVASVYRMNDLMRGSLDARTFQQMHVQVIDRGYAKQSPDGTMSGEPEDRTTSPTLMYDSLEPNLSLVAPIPSASGIAAERTLVVGERVWRMSFNARPGSVYAVDQALPNLVLASGVVISLLMSLLAAIMLRSRRLSGSLSALDAEQRALVDNPLAGIVFTDGHLITRGNRRVAELSGRRVEALAGVAIDDLLAGDADAEKFTATLMKIRESAIASEVELHLRRPDGATLLIDAYGKPLASGEVLWVIQDKTDALAMETERRAHADELKAANAELSASLRTAEIRAKEIALLSELSGMLQSCQSLDEVYAAIRTYAGYLFPNEAGALYLMSEKRDAVTRGAHWGALSSDVAAFSPQECWALRRGATFPTSQASQGLACSHACCAKAGLAFVCQPLVAQNNLLGLLYREHRSAASFDDGANQLATMLAEQVSLAIANLELREQLRTQAIRDALTGLHNRRFLEDALVREVARSARDNKPLAAAILDVDHFKKINDTHGHDAGDAVLRELGAVLRQRVGKTDIVGRFGGEEFLLLMPGADIDAAEQSVNEAMNAIRAMSATWPGGTLKSITASVGLATMPAHAATGDALLAAADAALYQAKREGRNRAVTAAVPEIARTGTGG